MSGRSDCIVVFMDLIGVKKRTFEHDSTASALMLSFHQLVRREMATSLHPLNHAYVWNDSVLLLAYVNDRSQTYEKALHAADDLKRKVDALERCYAIAVKGRAFPPRSAPASTRVTVISASSYALANCFKID